VSRRRSRLRIGAIAVHTHGGQLHQRLFERLRHTPPHQHIGAGARGHEAHSHADQPEARAGLTALRSKLRACLAHELQGIALGAQRRQVQVAAHVVQPRFGLIREDACPLRRAQVAPPAQERRHDSRRGQTKAQPLAACSYPPTQRVNLSHMPLPSTSPSFVHEDRRSARVCQSRRDKGRIRARAGSRGCPADTAMLAFLLFCLARTANARGMRRKRMECGTAGERAHMAAHRMRRAPWPQQAQGVTRRLALWHRFCYHVSTAVNYAHGARESLCAAGEVGT